MRLHELITDPGQIVTDLKAVDRWGAIDELISVLVRTSRIGAEHEDAVRAAVREREQTMSTGIGNGIGIPHGASDRVDRVQAVLGIARHDIDFESLDKAPVRIVLLFVVPQNQFQAHLDTLASIARLLSDESTRDHIREAADPHAALAIIRDRSRVGS
jgi:mannitol/fructose-specific phosphotransferase system IIA component (Ntr-type)